MRRSRQAVLLSILSFALMIALAAPAAPAQAQQDNDAATRILGLINQWRLDHDLWPLRVHPALQRMAEAQASYIFPIRGEIFDEGGYHKDASGRDARTRAYEVYKWPPYGRPDRVEAGENAAEFSVEDAFEFWQGSSIHAKAALSPAYREVGIAAIPLPRAPNKFLFYMTFGGRPNVLPVLYDPNRKALYLSADRSRYSANAAWTDVQVQLFNANKEALNSPTRWTRTILLPPDVGGTVYVQFKGPGIDVMTTVDLLTDTVILPNTANVIKVAEQAAAVEIAERQPTAMVILATGTPTIRATVMTSTPRGTAVAAAPTATRAATGTSAPATARPAGQADLTLTYNAGGLTLRNTSSTALNLTTLQVGSTTMTQWLRVASFPVEAFPRNHCLQVVRGSGVAPDTNSCSFVRGEVQANNAYWAQGTFDVLYNGTVVQTCSASASKCEIDLP